MKVERRYTTAGSDPYAGIAFVERTSRIVNPDGSVVFEATITAPEAWSQVAVDILAQKYFRKAGVARALRPVSEDGVPEWLQRHEPDDAALASLPAEERTGGETDAREVFRRLAGCWTYWGVHQRLLRGRGRARVLRRAARPCSRCRSRRRTRPQWFNTGLHWAYGIAGPAQGHWYADRSTGRCAARRARTSGPRRTPASSSPSPTTS